MKIAALIQAHQRPEQLSHLLDRLDGPLWAPYVHIDGKVDGETFSHLHGKAVFLSKRVAVHWGGLSQVHAAISLLRESYRDEEVTHFYHMSGQCFPVKTDLQIAERIGSACSGSGNLMTLTQMPVSHKPLYRYTKRAFFDVPNPFARRVLNRLAAYLPDRSFKSLRGIKLFGGSSWWLFDRETVRLVLEFVDNNPWFVKAFRFSTSSDEMVLHSLVKHLDIKIGGQCPTAAKWIEGRANPEPVTEEMHNDFVHSSALFGRKYTTFQPRIVR